MTGARSTSLLEKEVGDCQFCSGTNTVDILQQTEEQKFFGLFPMQPQIHRLAKCNVCKKSIKEEYYYGRTNPEHAINSDDHNLPTATAIK